MSLLDEALGAPECAVSVMGAHAGEDADAIFERKIEDSNPHYSRRQRANLAGMTKSQWQMTNGRCGDSERR